MLTTALFKCQVQYSIMLCPNNIVLCVDLLQMLQCLQHNAKERSEVSANATTSTTFAIRPTSTKMSMQELEELRKKLGNVTASSNVPQVCTCVILRLI